MDNDFPVLAFRCHYYWPLTNSLRSFALAQYQGRTAASTNAVVLLQKE